VNIDIEFNPAAFKHNITEVDIRIAVEKFIYDRAMPGDDNKHLLLGFDSDVNLLEVIYNVIDERSINIFHVMKCCKAYYSLIDF
jgi:hypothetical protein